MPETVLDSEAVGEGSFLAKLNGTRHEAPNAFSARIHAWRLTWRCIGGCGQLSTLMFCSPKCREKVMGRP